MYKYKIAALTLTAWLLGTACGSHHDDEGGNVTATPPPKSAYAVSITALDVVNKDSGEPVVVTGLPVAGGTLTIDD